MAKYSEYKNSGQQWLGMVPSHWNLQSVNSVLKEQKELVGKRNDLDLLSLTLNGVIFRDKFSGTGKMPSDFESYKIIRPNDLIFCLFDLDETPRTVGVAHQHGMITGAYDVFTSEDNLLIQFLYYYFLAIDNDKALKPYYSGLRKVVKINRFKHIQIPIPPREEQEAIVAYLDEIASDIDKAIAAKERINSSLEERRKIIITQAVTRGINPDAPMKDSSIDWLGEIPAHWEVIRIKYLLNEKKARSKNGTEEPLSMSQRKGLIPTKMMGVIPNLAASYVDAKLVSKGDLVFNKLKAHLGVFNVSEYDGLVSPDYAVYNSTGKADLKFLEYIFKTPNCINEFKKLITGVGAGLSRLYTNDLYSIYCAVPPIDEQLSIRNHIANQTKAISEAIDQCQSIIDLLRERKNIIINETVTGKVKVI